MAKLSHRALAFALIGALALVPAAASVLNDPFLLSLFSRVAIYAIAAVGLDLIVGLGGMVSFGHAAFVGIGGYAVAILAHHLGAADVPALLAWPVAVLAAAVAGLLIGIVSLRTDGVYFIMITLAFAQMLFYLVNTLTDYGGQDGMRLIRRNTLPGLSARDDMVFYYVCLALLAGLLYLAHRLAASRFGMVIRGCRQNLRRMNALGFYTLRYRLVAFVLAAATGGLAGALLANQSQYASPSLLHWTLSGELLVMVILGGMGTLVGPVLGAAAFVLLESTLSALTEHWMLFLGPFLVAIVLFGRRGLYGLMVKGAGDER